MEGKNLYGIKWNHEFIPNKRKQKQLDTIHTMIDAKQFSRTVKKDI